MEKDVKALENRIQLLEKELELKTKDLEIYRKELVEANQQLEALIINIHSQLKKALEIQRQIVPTEFPHIPGFSFSTKFQASSLSGGDYFDIFEHSDRLQFGVLMSAATGYGLSALFLSLFMKFTFEARQNELSQNPDGLLDAVKQHLGKHLQGEDAFHFFYGVIDRRRLQLSYLNIGNVAVMHYKTAQKTLTRLQFDVPAIDKNNPSPGIKSQTVDLEPTDKLVICSPGIFKVASPKGELFGEERLYSIIKKSADSDVHNLRNEIFFQAQNFAETKSLSADLTVIVLEVKERVLKLAST